MLYLLTPPAKLLWNAMPEDTIRIAKQHNGDLGKLEWDAAEEPHHVQTVIRVALRHGTECSRGIVFPAWILSEAERPQKLANLTNELVQKNAEVAAAHDGLMEAVIPGWTKFNSEQDKQLEESMSESIARAQKDADKLLNAPEIPHLVTVWERRGGMRYAH